MNIPLLSKPSSPQELGLSNRWKNRRRMAWVALLSMVAVQITCLFLVSLETLKVMESITSWFYTAMAAIVGSYVGFSTLDNKWQANGTSVDETDEEATKKMKLHRD